MTEESYTALTKPAKRKRKAKKKPRMPGPSLRRTGRSGPAAIAGMERQEEAMAMRRDGHSFQAIADHLGIVKSSAYALIFRGMHRTAKIHKKRADELREIEGERLDSIVRAMLPKVVVDLDTRAAEVVIKTIARRAALYGLDAPSIQRVTGGDGGPLKVVTNWSDLVLAALNYHTTEQDEDIHDTDISIAKIEPGE